MKKVLLPDEIADLLESVPVEKRGEFLRKHGFEFKTSPLSGGIEGGKQDVSTPSNSPYEGESMKLYTDGASRDNPGEAGAGFVILSDTNEVLYEGKKYLGITTNNVAEWKALYLGLRQAQEMGFRSVACYLDSELVVKQMTGEYKVKHPDLKPFYEKVSILTSQFENVTFTHVPREQNAHADRLSNEAIDEKS